VVCIPLVIRCLSAPCCTLEGLIVLRDHTNCVCGVAATVYGGNEAWDGFHAEIYFHPSYLPKYLIGCIVLDGIGL
jgi:hypothetical protein